MGDNTLPDQVAGIRQLGQRYRWMDLDRDYFVRHLLGAEPPREYPIGRERPVP
jgi:hypothetical protein